MPRPPKHPSGAKTGRTVKLSPFHWRIIDDHAAGHHMTRTDAVAALLEAAVRWHAHRQINDGPICLECPTLDELAEEP